jgi:hypothetical protein
VTDRSRVTTLETGNAAAANASSRGWFVGDLAAWAAERGESFDPASTPRQNTDVQVKWFVHPSGHTRATWAEPDTCYSLCILVDGDMRCDFRSVERVEETVLLARRGDYVIWHGPSWRHTWRTEGGCTVITVRWTAEKQW